MEESPPIPKRPRGRSKGCIPANFRATDGKSLIPEAVQAALGARTFAQASKPLSEDQRQLLSRSLKMDVDQFRQEFAAQLRSTAALLIDQLTARANELKPGEIPFALSVMVDKESALSGRASLQNASINVQVNNYGPLPKESLLSDLDGLSPSKPIDISSITSHPSPSTTHSIISSHPHAMDFPPIEDNSSSK